MKISTDDPIAVTVVAAIHAGSVQTVKHLLSENPGLATATIVNPSGEERTLLHIVADWPGHFPNGAATVAAIIAAGGDVNARFVGNHRETPLHWAASSDDVAVLDALLDGGANIEAPGAVFTDGTAMSDAVVFAQWRAAKRLVERGAKTLIWQAAPLGLLDRVKEFCAAVPPPSIEEIKGAFWGACRGGQRETSEFLLSRGAELNWLPPWDKLTPLDAARQSGNHDLIGWLRNQGAKTADEMG